MKRAIRSLMVLIVMAAAVAAPSVSRADDDEDDGGGEQKPKDDDEGDNAIRRQGSVFKENGLTTLPYNFTSEGEYRKGELTVTARVSVPSNAECAATPKTYTITIASDVTGGSRTVAIGGVGKLTAKVKGQIKVTIDVSPDPGCDLMLEAGGWYSPDAAR